MPSKTFDLLSLDVHTLDPEPIYEYLREEEPLYWDETNQLWAVSRYEDVVFASRNTDIFSSGNGVVPGVSQEDWPDEAMINLDGKEHTKQRALVSKGFTPRRINALEEHAREIVIELIDAIKSTGECDIVQDLAKPLPMRLIGEMLGYPREMHDEILSWTDVFTHAGCGPAHITDAVVEAFSNFSQYHFQLVEERKANPGNDLLSVWLHAELNGEKLGEEKLLFEHNLLLVGGSETTRNAISGGFLELINHPDQRQHLIDHPEAIPNAVEEIIRWSSPFVRMARTLTQDYHWHGKDMKEGQQILMLYPAANRDPRIFENPQTFDIHRSFERPSVSFGYGQHFCLGAALARLELRIMFEEVFKRIPDMQLKPGKEPLKHSSCFIRGFSSLPVVFTAV